MSNFTASKVPTLLRLFYYMGTEERKEWVITCRTSFRRARANFWKLKAELHARRHSEPFPIGDLFKDNLFVIRTHTEMESWESKQAYDDIACIGREWVKMNAEQEGVVRDLDVARGIQLAPEQMEESRLMRYLYWERAIDYKYNMPLLDMKEELMQQYVKERIEKWKEGEVGTWS